MKKIILPIVLLAAFTAIALLTIPIPEKLPDSAVIPDEITQILEKEKVEKAIILSDFRNKWFFFDTMVGLVVFAVILLTGTSGRMRDNASRWATRITKNPKAPLVWGTLFMLGALGIVFLTATRDQLVSGGNLVMAALFGITGVFFGKSKNYTKSALYLIQFVLLLFVIYLPMNYYRSFVVEHHFELSKETFSGWMADLLKGEFLIGLLFWILLTPLAYWGIRKLPRTWWIILGAGATVLLILVMVISPVFIDPMFNKYEPLKDEVLKQRLLDMAGKAGISGSRVFQVDMSKDTEAINAYVTGMFGAKRIVLWDTILTKLNHDEIAFVMAHEMTHYVRQHIWKMIGILSVVLFILLFIISRTIHGVIGRFKKQLGFREVSDIASLPLLLLMFSVLMFLITPVFNLYSRHIEREADRFGLELTGDRESAVTAFVKLANENLSNPSPSPVIEFWLYDHPALKKRIDFCKNHPLPGETNAVQ